MSAPTTPRRQEIVMLTLRLRDSRVSTMKKPERFAILFLPDFAAD